MEYTQGRDGGLEPLKQNSRLSQLYSSSILGKLFLSFVWVGLAQSVSLHRESGTGPFISNSGTSTDKDGPQDLDAGDGFLLLRSKSFNTVSQLEVTGIDSYTISEVGPRKSFIDSTIQPARLNLTGFSKGSYYHKVPKSPVLAIKTFFSGRSEKIRKIGILTNQTLDIYHAALQDDAAQGQGRWQYDLVTLSDSVPGCTFGTTPTCQFWNFLHRANETRDLFIVEVKVTDPSTGDWKLKLVIISEDSIKGKANHTVEWYDLPQIPVDHKFPDRGNCVHPEMLVVKIFRPATNLSILVARYCSLASTEDPEATNAVYFGGVVIAADGSKSYQRLGVFPKVQTSKSDSRELSELRLLNLQMSSEFMVMATSEGFLYNNFSVIENDVASGRYPDTQADGSMKMYLLHPQQMSAVYCNFLNLFELCCTVEWRPPGQSHTQLKVIELVKLETNIVVANLPLEINIMSPENRVLESINTKNYLLVRGSQGFWACSRKGLSLQKITTDPSPYNGTYCAKISMEDGSEVQAMKELFFEENFSNVIDGYIVVVVKSEEEPNSYFAKPLLITGPYFVLSTDVQLDSYVCERYLPHCGQTTMDFINVEYQQGKIKKRIYLIDDKFTSIIYVSPNTKMDSYLADGKFYFDMNDYFYGDIQEPTISRSIEMRVKNLMVPKVNESFYAAVNKMFTITVPEFYPRNPAARDVLKKWAYLRFNRDGTITAAVCKDSTIDFRGVRVPVRTIAMTQPNLALSYNDSDYSREYSAKLEERAVLSNQTILQAISEARDSIDLLDWRISQDPDTKQKTLIIRIKRFLQHSHALVDICSYSLDLGLEEKFCQVRSQVYNKNNLVLILTDKKIVITKVMFDKVSFIEKMIEIPTSDLMSGVPDKDRYDLRDILFVENIFLLDAEIVGPDKQVRNAIYLYNFDFDKRFFYSYGYMTLPRGSMPGDYQLYYSKLQDKAVLVLYAEQVMAEYSLDNVFLELTNLGKELKRDCTVSLKSYGPHKIKKFLLPDFRQNSTESRRQMKTLLTPFNDRFPVLALVEDAGEKILVILVEIGTRVLSNFKSHWLDWREGDWVAMPTIVEEGPRQKMLPLVMINNRTGDMKLTFLWFTTRLELNYRNIISNSILKSSGEQESKSLADQQLKLTLRFSDPDERMYEETFRVSRDPRFLLTSDGLERGQRAFGFEVVNTHMERFGLVSTIGLECPAGETQGIYRNMSRHIFCPVAQFNCSFQNSMNRELVADFSSPNSWNDTRDFMRLTHVLPNTYVLLSDRNVVFFHARSKMLRYLLILNTSAQKLDIRKCTSIRSAQMKEDGATLAVNLYCTDSLSAFDVEIHVQLSTLKAALSRQMPKQLNVDSVTYKNKIEEKIWRSVSENKQDYQTLDQIFVVSNEMNLLSIGTKKFLDFYFIKYAEPGRWDTLKYLLVNSTLNDKYSESKLLSFRLVRPLGDQGGNSGNDKKRYRLVQVTWIEKSQSIEASFYCLEVTAGQEMFLRLETSFKYLFAASGVTGEKPEVLYGDMRISDDEEYHSDNPTSGQNKETTARNYSFYFISNNYVYEFIIQETWDAHSRAQSFERVGSKNTSELFVKYNYAGLCELTSTFKLFGWKNLLLLTCLPLIHDPTEESFLVVYQRPLCCSPQTVNPSHTLHLSVGQTSATSFQEVFMGEDGFPRLLKTSAMFLLEQYILYPSSRLVFFVEQNQHNDLDLGLHVGNNYELQRIKIPFNEERWRYLDSFLNGWKEEVGFTVVMLVYGFCFLIVWILVKQRKYVRTLDSIYAKSDGLPSASARETKLSTLPSQDSEPSSSARSSFLGDEIKSPPAYQTESRQRGFWSKLISRQSVSNWGVSPQAAGELLQEICV